ncbi:MAG TPA: TonB-dependent receptor [Terriglobales bacterium]|nr:TonB-dependent receptor [Terriglobales bacterium]
MRRVLLIFIPILLVLAASAQNDATAATSLTQTFEIRGTATSGKTPLPGVTITATNTLTGKKIATSTDAQGNFVLQPPARGRWVIKADFPAFAAVTKEAVINPSTPSARVDLDLVLLSRVPKTTDQVALQQTLAGVMNNRGAQSLSLTGTGMQGDGSTSDMPTDAPAMASSADAMNESVSFAGSSGRTQDFGSHVDDIRDRIEEMRARGELGQGGDMMMMGGGPGGGPGNVVIIAGPGGGGGPGMPRMRIGRGNLNRPHGSIFYSAGNSIFDAAPYSLSGTAADKPEYSSNRFGGTIGGPLPKFIDPSQKTFTFLNIFGTRSSNPYQVFSHVPTALERSGDFSQTLLSNGQSVQIYDPNTGTVGNKISNIDPIASGLLNYIPLPNQPGLQNYRFSDSAENNSVNIGFRIMRSFGSGASAGPRRGPFGRNNINFGLNYTNSDSDQLRPFQTVRGTSKSTGWNVNGGYTKSFGKWTNQLRVSYNRNKIDITNLYAGITDIEGGLGITGVSQNPQDWGLPSLAFANYSGLSDVSPVLRTDNNIMLGDTVMWRRGKHNIRFGGDYRRQLTNLKSNTNPRGSFTFTGLATSINGATGTGYDFADFLLGIPQQTSIQYSPNQYSFASNGWNFFFMDDWRVAANLSVNVGLRYEYTGPFTEAHNQLVNLDPSSGFTGVVPVQPGQSSPNNGVYPNSLVNPDRNNWAPRIGIAWKPMDKTVVRAGYGINYNLAQYRSIVQQLAFQPPFSFTQTNVLSPSTPLSLANGFPAATEGITNNYGIDVNYGLGYVQMWNLNIQRELKGNFMLNVGYTGSKGTGLDIVRAPNRGPEGLRIEGVQPFLWESSEGSSILHAGNVRLRRRFTKGVSFGATYTFSKSIDNASSIGGGATVVAQNDLDLAAERGLSSFDQRHRFTGDFMIGLPFGDGRKWLSHPGMLRTVFGDWNWNGSFNIASGFPFTARILGSYSDVSRGTNGTLRADYTGAPISLDSRSVQQWFNTAAFVLPATGQFGNAGRNTIVGPSTVTFNMSLGKEIQLREMMGLEIRADATNIFNTPQFTSIDTVVNSPTFGQVVGVGSTRRIQLSARYRF